MSGGMAGLLYGGWWVSAKGTAAQGETAALASNLRRNAVDGNASPGTGGRFPERTGSRHREMFPIPPTNLNPTP